MIFKFSQLGEIRAYHKTIVHCHGVFDILHAGHLAYLEAAKDIGGKDASLVVTITADRFVNKGPGKPVFTAETRARMLDALHVVDFVIISDFPTATPAIEALKPHFYVKGPDYRDRTKDVTGEIYKEEAAVLAGGGKIAFTEDETHSSSTLANKFFANWNDDQLKMIEKAKSLGGIDAITKTIDNLSKLRVAVVGEPILDTYRFCEPQNLSSKSPSISAKFTYEENYNGGTWAIESHISDFVKDSICLYPAMYEVPRKIRYITQDKNQRIFEITHIDEKPWATANADKFIRRIKSFNEYDMVVVGDFGHGLIEGQVLDSIQELKPFIALNVQTNSSNYGYNPYLKHERFDYLSIDTREARVAFHDRHSSPIDLAKRIHVGSEKPISLTCGPNGAYFIRRENNYFSPAFTDHVVDATGAGDAYFAMTSMLVATGCNPELVPFLGNVFAGLKTKIIGNKQNVTKAQFMKAITGVLK